MGALSRPYGRRVRPLDLTPVPYLTAALIPIALLSVLVVLTLRLFPYASKRILVKAQQSTASEILSTLPNTPNLGDEIDFSAFSPSVRVWKEAVLRWSAEYDLPPLLVAIVMQIESCGAPQVVSSAGAVGLFQVMPYHFAPNENSSDPEVNAIRGLTYLARAYELAQGDIRKTLAGYNGGHSVIDRHPAGWAEETTRYVAWGTGIWDDLQTSDVQSDTLVEWLEAGGEHLCRRALESNQPR